MSIATPGRTAKYYTLFMDYFEEIMIAPEPILSIHRGPPGGLMSSFGADLTVQRATIP